MVDEKLSDQVWVTVVATGFGEPHPAPSVPEREPRGAGAVEPARRERRRPLAAPRSSTRRVGLGITELDVPEFIPRR